MSFKKACLALLFPHTAICILLLPTATTWLIYSMTSLPETSPIRIASYLLAFYTLTVWCARLPRIIRFFTALKNKNKYISAWLSDPHLRLNVTLIGNVAWNGAYAALQLGMGIYHRSVWFYSLFAYYACLAAMRFFIVRHTLRHKAGENMQAELKHYRACGIAFLFMNSAISVMMLYMLREDSAIKHSEITTIALAAYTFTTLFFAILNAIKYRKYNSPAMSAAKAIALAAACVSILTLENTMLNTFSGSEMTPEVKRLFLSLSGGAISLLIIVISIYMILRSRKISEE